MEENSVTKNYLETSHHYYYDILTWCIQSSKPKPFSKRITHLCRDPKVFIMFAVAAVLVGFLAFFIQQFERNPKWDWNHFVVNHCFHHFSQLNQLLSHFFFIKINLDGGAALQFRFTKHLSTNSLYFSYRIYSSFIFYNEFLHYCLHTNFEKLQKSNL